MLTTIACVVFFSSIIVFFSEEIRLTIIKLAKSRRVQFIAPLFICSWIVVHYEWHVLMFLVTCRLWLSYVVYFISKLTPWGPGRLASEQVLTLMLIISIPIGLTDLLLKWYKPRIGLRRIMLKVSAFFWVFCAFLLVVHLNEYYF
ncbi:MAG: hypothetical protein Q8R83_00775 [Legionellaceae bacterium]|nr:hypothetical protein [Legionellaceae bacterium]